MNSFPLISTGLQPGVPAGEEPSRFNGLVPASGLKPLKRFHLLWSLHTRLKPGANEKTLASVRMRCQPGGLPAISRGLRSEATIPPVAVDEGTTTEWSQPALGMNPLLAPLRGAPSCSEPSGGVAALNPRLMADIASRWGSANLRLGLGNDHLALPV